MIFSDMKYVKSSHFFPCFKYYINLINTQNNVIKFPLQNKGRTKKVSINIKMSCVPLSLALKMLF